MRNFVILLFCIAFGALVFVFVRLYPPDQLTLASGPAGGAYHQAAEKYADILARDGIRLNIVDTAGSVENAELLARGEVDAAFLQGGIPVPREQVEAVGAVFYEPILFIVKAGASIPNNAAKWEGLRINSGTEGSGTAAAFRDFENVAGLSHSENIHFGIPYDEAIAALIDDRLDIATFVAPLDAPYLVEAFGDPRLRVLDLDHADAISRRLSYANLVTVPSGGLLLDPVTPTGPREIIALEARLVVQSDLHPALVDRLTMAAIELHHNRGVIADANDFPSVNGTGLTINTTARLLIQEGPSTWHDWLPYWIAAQINRVFLLFLPFVFIVLPVLRMMPAGYAYLMRRRVWRHYPEIRKIEDELAQNPDRVDLDGMRRRLTELEDRLSLMQLPAAYRQVQYDARLHLQLAQARIVELQHQRDDAEANEA